MSAAPATVAEALLLTAERSGADRGYRFLHSEGSSSSFLSFEELAVKAAACASAFVAAGARSGDRVGLILPENQPFIVSFFGCMHGGMIPVPIAPPMNVGKLGTFLEHLRHIVHKSEPTLLITSAKIKGLLGSLVGGSLKRICTPDELEWGAAEIAPAKVAGESLAFLQFTSGSTAAPKGVALTHRNLLTNASCIMFSGVRVTPDDVGCSWLPLFHDMGLIGFVIAPAVSGTPAVLMSPLNFIKRPVEWLRMISDYRGTLSFGPNFSYGLCAKRIKEEELEGIDLGSWRVAGCGAEPIQAATLRGFAERFATIGFRERALMPSFGMAESTLAVSFSPLGRELKTDRVDFHELVREKTARPSDSAESVEVVSCGLPFEQHDIAILSEEGVLLPERSIGEVIIRGPSVMREYFRDQEATAAVFWGEWLRTGDVGYVAEGELYICGRSKEVIIHAGKNYYPNDLEFVASEAAGVRKGNVIAFGLSDVVHGEEAIVVCAETKSPPEAHREIEAEIRSRVLEAFGLKIDHVLLLPQNALPKTSSGKLQRRKAKELYLNDELGVRSGGAEALEFMKHWAVSQWNYLRQRRQDKH
jgi:fatty-acyl-CoA synthase